MATIRDPYAPAASPAIELQIAGEILATHREEAFDLTITEIRTDRATGRAVIEAVYEREPS